MRTQFRTLIAVAALCGVTGAQGQERPAGEPAPARVGGRPMVGPVVTDRYRSTLVKLGGTAVDGLLFEPLKPGPNARVAVLYSNSNFNFDPPAAELANRGYRVSFVRHPGSRSGQANSPDPFDGFQEASRGIAYLRSLPGVERVVVEGWGAGAGAMSTYANLAAHGPAACQRKEILLPCATEQASGLAKPDGVILLDPGGGGTRASSIDPAYDGNTRNRPDLDMYSAANGYDAKTGTATYSADFRKKYFAAQRLRQERILEDAIARLKTLQQTNGPSANEPMFVPGAVNSGEMANLANSDLSLLSHTKRPHILLRADGSKPVVLLRSIRPPTGPVGADAIATTVSRTNRPASAQYSLREYLANGGSRITKNYALTEDDVVGVDWKTSMSMTGGGNAAGISVPTLVMTNTCFQFVVGSEITYDHLAAKDKTIAGIEGSEHFFTPCRPEFGDTKQRLFDFVADWLGKSKRF